MMNIFDVYPEFKGLDIIIWGTGDLYNKMTRRIEINPTSFVDNNSSKWGRMFDGKPVNEPSVLKNFTNNQFVLIIMSSFLDEITSQIKSMDVNVKYILTWQHLERDIGSYNQKRVEQLTEQYTDELSRHQCDLCGQSSFELLYNRGRTSEVLLNYICSNCGFVFTFPRLTLAEHEVLYQGGEFSRQARHSEKPDENQFINCEYLAYERYKLLENILAEELYVSKSRRVVEIGSGTGSFLNLMSMIGWETFGIEPDHVYAKASMERYNIQVEDVMLESSSITQRSATFVCSFHVIEHVESPSEFLYLAKNLLKDDGYIFIECPGIEKMHKPLDEFFWDVHINTFSEKLLCAFLQKAGFKVLQSGFNKLGFLWVLGQKAKEHENQLIPVYENPWKIKNIVMTARSPYKLNAPKVAILPEKYTSKYKIGHIGYHQNSNAGDTLLFPYVRKVFQHEIENAEFKLIDIQKPVTEETVSTINQLDALIIGGGELFLPDINPNDKPGWQWACSVDLLKKINIPIFVFAVGFNRFSGQEEFKSIFNESLSMLVEKSSFFGVRNYGGIKAIQNYIPEHLWNKVEYQPCPTTFINHLESAFKPKERTSRRIALNIATDRPNMRFGEKQQIISKRLSKMVRLFQNKGWEVVLFNHHRLDEHSRILFRSNQLNLEEVNLNGAAPEDVIKAYRGVDLCIGMRGYAQMVPFGLGVPIFSLISHDKLQYFLEDIVHPDWGIDVHSENFDQEIVDWLTSNNLNKLHSEILTIQEKLWEMSKLNLGKIRNLIE